MSGAWSLSLRAVTSASVIVIALRLRADLAPAPPRPG